MEKLRILMVMSIFITITLTFVNISEITYGTSADYMQESSTAALGPTVTIESPESGTILNNTINPSIVIVSYYSAGGTTSVTNASVYVDGKLVYYKRPYKNHGYLNYSWAYLLYNEGKHIIKIKITTPVSYASDSIDLYVNLKKPYCYIENPSNNSIISGASVSFYVGAIDDGSGIYSIEYYMDDTLLNVSYFYWLVGYKSYIFDMCSIDTTKYEDGVHYIYAKVYDNSGNIHSNEPGWSYTTPKYRVIIDNNPPIIKISNLTDSSFVSGSVNITVNAKDNGSGVAYVDFYIDGNFVYTTTTCPYTYSWNTSVYSNKTHTIKIIAYDNAGFHSSATIHVTVDNIAPCISIISPLKNSTINGRKVVINFVAKDDLSGIKKCEIKVDNGTWIDLGKNTTWTLENLSNGKHTLYIMAIDNAGNTAIEKIEFTVEPSIFGFGLLETLPWWVFAIIIGIAVLITVIVGILRRRKKHR